MDDSIHVSIDVKNTGKKRGKESILVYLTDEAASVSRPNKQLKAFEKIELNPGEEQTVNFTLTPDSLSFIGLEMKRIVEAGQFTVSVANEKQSFWITE